MVGHLGTKELGDYRSRGGDADAGLDSCGDTDHEMTRATTTTTAAWREFLVPIRLLQEKRVRAILFVYGIYSVSIAHKVASPVGLLEIDSIGGRVLEACLCRAYLAS